MKGLANNCEADNLNFITLYKAITKAINAPTKGNVNMLLG
jgi:hypothetical protein